MKLRNKKTGEIIDVYKGQVLLHYDNGRKTIHFKSLEELEEWEDYEEPKEYWTIDWSCTGVCANEYSGDNIDEFNKEIGNYFETEEEAEKAMEKLKAWKRLKDKGFKFCKYTALAYGEINFRIPDFEGWNNSETEQVRKDMDLLFGGVEWIEYGGGE